MQTETYKACLKIAVGFKDKYGVVVKTNVFKDVMSRTLYKIARNRKQLEEYTDVEEYIPLLFEDCLREHYMFSLCKGGKA